MVINIIFNHKYDLVDINRVRKQSESEFQPYNWFVSIDYYPMLNLIGHMLYTFVYIKTRPFLGLKLDFVFTVKMIPVRERTSR